MPTKKMWFELVSGALQMRRFLIGPVTGFQCEMKRGWCHAANPPPLLEGVAHFLQRIENGSTTWRRLVVGFSYSLTAKKKVSHGESYLSYKDGSLFCGRRRLPPEPKAADFLVYVDLWSLIKNSCRPHLRLHRSCIKDILRENKRSYFIPRSIHQPVSGKKGVQLLLKLDTLLLKKEIVIWQSNSVVGNKQWCILADLSISLEARWCFTRLWGFLSHGYTRSGWRVRFIIFLCFSGGQDQN